MTKNLVTVIAGTKAEACRSRLWGAIPAQWGCRKDACGWGREGMGG